MTSLPEDFKTLLAESAGPERARTVQEALEAPPSVSVRLNPAKLRECPFPDATTVPWSPYGDMISRVIIDSGVTSVGDVAFCACGKLKSAEIADSVTFIGYYSFAGCKSLYRYSYG